MLSSPFLVFNNKDVENKQEVTTKKVILVASALKT